MRVLIVDDSQIVCDRLGAMIGELGSVEVRSADRATEAIDALRRELPQVVILDLMLPDGASFQLISHIKSFDRRITVIVLTNYPFGSYRQLSMDRGADYFLDKSSEFDQAVAIIEELAGRVRA